MKKLLFIQFLIPLLFKVAFSQTDIVGDWEGKIITPVISFDINIRFVSNGQSFHGNISIPEQGANNLPLSNVLYNFPEIKFDLDVPDAKAFFDGKIYNKDSIAGSFKQLGFKGIFYLLRVVETKIQLQPDFLIREEKVIFFNGINKFEGTLTIPNKLQGEKYPVLILITGSGAQTRDEEIAGFKVFKVLAEHFTKNGIAVLRYDDRNTGNSIGISIDSSTTEDFADDVISAVEYLSSRNDINSNLIGLLGHSEGGIVASITASKCKNIAFVICMAGTGVSGKDIILEQTKLIQQVSKKDTFDIQVTEKFLQRMIETSISDTGWEEIRFELRSKLEEEYDKLADDVKSFYQSKENFVEKMTNSQINIFKSRWMKFFLTYNPVESLKQVKCPVLLLFGGKDLQVPYYQNEKPMLEALQKAENNDVTLKVFWEANHLFQKAETGLPSEYKDLKKEFVEGFLDFVTAWILTKVKLLNK
ncbi:MAG: alpha/beta hydrolase family protein [Ignavibacteria bacterium]